MTLFLSTTLSGLELGLVYAVAALGMYIAYSVLDFPDLTADGSFPLGGVVSSILLYRTGLPPVAALLFAALAGAACGALTGVLHARFRITPLLSGIIVMTALLSVTLGLTTFLSPGGTTLVYFSYITNGVRGLFNPDGGPLARWVVLLILFGAVAVVKVLLDLFFRTRLGHLLIATGDNPGLVTSLGRDPGIYKILGLAIANGLVALGGALFAGMRLQYDNTSGSGIVVLTLASVIIGTVLFSRARRVRATTATVAGALIYALCLNYFVLLDPNGIYLKVMNAVAFACILIIYGRASRRRTKGGTPHGGA